VFFKGSRYTAVAEHEITDERGRVLRYKGIRFMPDSPADLGYVIQQGDRLDLVAHRAYRDPERFWRIADANRALWPPDLVAEPGATILIPPADG
jgi:nucleoid-associated protein YgaU